jgi:hypothetical protein
MGFIVFFWSLKANGVDILQQNNAPGWQYGEKTL